MTASASPGHNDLVRERFTRTAQSFSDFVFAYRTEQAERLAQLALEDAPDAQNWRALDVACGPGTFARAIAPRVRATTGVDLTLAMLSLAEEAFSQVSLACNFVCADAARLPFLSQSFDLVTCGYAFHHMPNPGSALAEMTRVVRPGGRVAVLDIVTPSGASQEANSRIERARDPSHVDALRFEQIRELFASQKLRARAEEISKTQREFDNWMSVVNAEPGSPVYNETRALMEATLEDDSAGFHPRRTADGALHFDATSVCIVAEK
ncbi:MAG TPA: class I SAM-dependent methyltransferase [Candidatus Acidoferrales bacterium]|nr:class I SAM-dependent methyltransferase [Candidatus Acidoferrales bacterium]